MRAREREVGTEIFVWGLTGSRRAGGFKGRRLEREKNEQRDISKEREGKREKKREKRHGVMRIECVNGRDKTREIQRRSESDRVSK